MNTIVMLARLVEDNKVSNLCVLLYMTNNFIVYEQIKCCQYWPSEGSIDFGSIKVTLQKEDKLANYCIRQMLINKVASYTSILVKL